jgi:hypothetical protein
MYPTCIPHVSWMYLACRRHIRYTSLWMHLRYMYPACRAIRGFARRDTETFCSGSVGALTSLARDTRDSMASTPSVVAQELAEVRDLKALALDALDIEALARRLSRPVASNAVSASTRWRSYRGPRAQATRARTPPQQDSGLAAQAYPPPEDASPPPVKRRVSFGGLAPESGPN